MPKELIYDETREWDVTVAWKKGAGGYVQVGIVTHDGVAIAERLHVPSLSGGPSQRLSPEGPLFNGVWGTFDREGINRLIRMLRHARDQAYGRDE